MTNALESALRIVGLYPAPWAGRNNGCAEDAQIVARALLERDAPSSANARQEIIRLREDIERLRAEREALREALEDLLKLCEHGNFTNGVTSQDGRDEGDYWASVYMDRARAALSQKEEHKT